MTVAYLLVGLPGSGKSYWASSFFNRPNNMKLVSTDAYIEQLASATGKTYSDLFDAEFGNALDWMKEQLAEAIENRNNIIWDQTNLTVKSRKSKVKKLIDAGYRVIAVFFDCSTDVAEQRRIEREQKTGKHIPTAAVQSMTAQLTPPSLDEGFEKIIVVRPE
jgi:predicted kinase